MRLRENGQQIVYLREPIIGQDDEGHNLPPGWGTPVAIKMTVQAAGGAVNAQIWGKQLKYIKAGKYQGNLITEGVNENWGVCLNVSKDSDPDYLINAIQTFSTHKNITLEKRDQGGTNG
ncbi:hypothetical protein DLJ48_06860 [Oenococcus sicerae]|uniref:Prophage protein n=1 Tax=Oenococcus sicerae TaxID=2203724 RepID=A0ABX5QN77_9LACO|nr:hypothetical protein [Oenococcus sicerae]QAS70260.1 hypothetical protein DLJ48_06860 [Oenococcus sicerae]